MGCSNGNEAQNKKKIIEKVICRIILDKKTLNGFLCNIPFPDSKNLLPVLIINDNILENSSESSIQKINLTLYDDPNKIYSITIEEKRKIYIDNKENNKMTIIEIKDKDGLDIESFLEIVEINLILNINVILKMKYYMVLQ